MSEHSHDDGMKIRRTVLGNGYVDQTVKNTTEFDSDFQTYITESAWASVWARGHLTLRERSMITVAVLAALGQPDELALHLQGTRNTGASREDIKEVLMQVAVYAGIPAANSAFKIAKAFYADKPGPNDTSPQEI